MIKVPRIREETLGNGIKVIYAKSRAYPAILAVIRAGSFYETEDNSGISHVSEHLLFSGTNQDGMRTEDEIYYRIHELTGDMDNGRDWSCYTTFDHVTLGLRTLLPDFESAAHLISSALSESQITPLKVEREKQMVIDEMAGYSESNYMALIPMFLNAVFKQHPMRKYPGGDTEKVRNLLYENVLNFYREMFVPEAIIITGNVPFSEAMRVSEAYFGHFGQPKRVYPPNDEPENYDERVTMHAGLQRSHLMTGLKVFNTSARERDLLKLAGAYFGRRFYEKIYTQEAIAYYCYGSYMTRIWESALNYGFLVASVNCDEKFFGHAQEIIEESFWELTALGFPSEIITQLGQSFSNSYLFIRENSLNTARLLMADYLRSGVRHPDEYTSSFRAYSAQMVEDAVKKYITPVVKAGLLTRIAIVPK